MILQFLFGSIIDDAFLYFSVPMGLEASKADSSVKEEPPLLQGKSLHMDSPVDYLGWVVLPGVQAVPVPRPAAHMNDVVLRKAIGMFNHIQIAWTDKRRIFLRCKTVRFPSLDAVIDSIASGFRNQSFCQQGIGLCDYIQRMHDCVFILTDMPHDLRVI